MRFNDAILGLVILLGGLAIVLEARTFPPTHGQAYGPDLFPTIIGTGLMLAGLGLVVMGWQARRTTGWLVLGDLPPARLVDAALVIAVIIAFIALTNTLGFVLTGGLGIWCLMLRFGGGSWWATLLLSLVVVLLVDWSFRAMLLVPLPQGDILPALPW